MHPLVELGAKWTRAALKRAVHEEGTTARKKGRSRRRAAPAFSFRQILDQLNAWEPLRGRVVLVHSSFSALKPAGLSPTEMCHAFMELVGDAGTLVMPAHSTSLVHGRDDMPDFDVAAMPSERGILTETFRKMTSEGVLRSRHPTHSAVARGPLSRELTEGHERAPYAHGYGTPYAKLVEADALSIGLAVFRATTIHTPEDMFGDDYPVQPFWRTVRGHVVDGTERFPVEYRLHLPDMGIWMARRWLWREFQGRGVAHIGQVGECSLYLMAVRPQVDHMVSEARQGRTPYIYAHWRLAARRHRR